MKIRLSPAMREKLTTKHNVTAKEVEECFINRVGRDLFDTRAEHLTNPLRKL